MKRALLILAALAAPARADMPASNDWVRVGSIAVNSAAEADVIAARLQGHLIRKDPGRVWITDVAGMGSPWVGVVERRGRALWLVMEGGVAFELRGPLARPRLAGPGYTIWVLGELDPQTGRMAVRRLGVLRAPAAPPN